MRYLPSNALCLVASIGLAVLAVGCSDDETGTTPASQGACIARAVRPADARIAGRLRPLPRDERPEFATILRRRDIDGDPRLVLPGVRSSEGLRRVELSLPEDAAKPYRARISLTERRYDHTKRVIVAPRVRLDDWVELEPALLDVERDSGGRFVELEIDLSAHAGHAGAALLAATVYAAPAKRTVRHETPPLRFDQAKSWLEFGLSIPKIARNQGPVRFRVEACAKAHCECLHEEVVDPEAESGHGWQDRLLPIGDLDGRGDRQRGLPECRGSPQSLRLL